MAIVYKEPEKNTIPISSKIQQTFTFFTNSLSAFDANNHDASMLSDADLKAMVAEAMKVNPPKNGKN